MNVSMWVGQRAYIEIIDDGDGFAAVDRVLFSDDGAPTPTAGWLASLLDDDALDTPEALARKFQDTALKIARQWQDGSLAGTADVGDRIDLLNWLLRTAAPKPTSELTALGDKLRQAEARLPEPRRALAMLDGTPWTPHVYIRGNPKSLGSEVPRRFLEAIVGDKAPATGRLELARRLVDPANPLVARVMVNRLWQHHFGEGLVRSVDNFGVLGERPTHPELLDWLATEFVRQGWSIKKMHRLMLLSHTYQMASRSDDAKAAERDPQNKLLHRMPIRRLEAECIRDAILAVSGRLDRTQFGPGVMPHLTPFMAGRGRPGQSGPLDGAGRRSIYINVRRNFLTPFFMAFDYPTPFTTIGRRSVSNVPAQALALMNNPFVVEQAGRWAQRVLAVPDRTAAQRVADMYVTAFGRPPTEEELKESLEFVTEQGRQHGAGNEAKAWADLGHVLLNVKEFIFIN
jgi:hypothetical protein